MGAVIMVVAIVLLAAPATVNAAWSKKYESPYQGRTLIQNQSLIYPATSRDYSVSPLSFNLTSGIGGFSAAAWGNSTGVGSANSTYIGKVKRETILSYELPIWIDVPFRNHSGGRTVNSVNITFDYSAIGNYSFIAGNCPYVKAIREANLCNAGLDASVDLFAYGLSYPDGRHSFGENITCSRGCGSRPNLLLYPASAYTNTFNRSTGASYQHSRGPSPYSRRGTVSFLMVPAIPLTHSATLQIEFGAIVELGIGFEVRHGGAGGLQGSSGYVATDFSFVLVSVVES